MMEQAREKLKVKLPMKNQKIRCRTMTRDWKFKLRVGRRQSLLAGKVWQGQWGPDLV
jgi:hypothetical protein